MFFTDSHDRVGHVMNARTLPVAVLAPASRPRTAGADGGVRPLWGIRATGPGAKERDPTRQRSRPDAAHRPLSLFLLAGSAGRAGKLADRTEVVREVDDARGE